MTTYIRTKAAAAERTEKAIAVSEWAAENIHYTGASSDYLLTRDIIDCVLGDVGECSDKLIIQTIREHFTLGPVQTLNGRRILRRIRWAY